MTNAMIILSNQIQLQEAGVLHFTGKKIEVMNLETGEPELIDEIQPIHTYEGWKARGYQVKKGSKAVAKFAIWKFAVKKNQKQEDDEEQKKEETGTGRMFMKVAAFFTDEQVEEIKK